MKRLSALVLIAGIIFFGLVTLYAIFIAELGLQTTAGIAVYSVLVAFMVLLALSLKLNDEARLNLVVMLISTCAALYAVEAYTTLTYRSTSVEETYREARVKAAQEADIPFDQREPLKVIRDFEKQGIAAVPYVHSEARIRPEFEIRVAGEKYLALSGISNKQTVVCNETGRYMVFESDEHGFHNPKGMFTSKQIDVVVIGDSFAQGLCVESNSNAVATIRESFPGTLNLGYAGNNPLFALASLKEFVPSLANRPKHILWFFYEDNDLVKLDNSILLKYLERNFRQDLAPHQVQIDEALNRVIEANREFDANGGTLDDLVSFILFRSTREWLGFDGLLRDESEPSTVVGFDEGLSQFRQVVSEAKAVSSSWGSNLYFVYLPGWQSVSTQQPFEHRQEVLAIVEENDVRVIDLYDKFVAHHDSASLFPLRMENHYNADGYRLVADTILEALEN